MEEESCWVCGSQMLKKEVLKRHEGGWIVIQCKSCLAELVVAPIGRSKNRLRRLPEKDGKAGV